MMDLMANPGDTVIFANENAGYESDIEKGKEHLEKGKTYTIERLVVGSCHSQVWLKEVPRIPFNTVQFDNGDMDPILAAAKRAYIKNHRPDCIPMDSDKLDLRSTIEVVRAVVKDLLFSDADIDDPIDDEGFNIAVTLLSATIVGLEPADLVEFTGIKESELLPYVQKARAEGIFTEDDKIACDWFNPETGSTEILCDVLVIQGLLKRV